MKMERRVRGASASLWWNKEGEEQGEHGEEVGNQQRTEAKGDQDGGGAEG